MHVSVSLFNHLRGKASSPSVALSNLGSANADTNAIVVRSPVIVIPKYDIFSRVQRLEDSMFTKEDAKEMKAEMKAEAKEMKAEMKAEAKEMKAEMKAEAKEMKAEMKAEANVMRTEMESRMNAMFVVSTIISLLNPLIGAYNTFFKDK